MTSVHSDWYTISPYFLFYSMSPRYVQYTPRSRNLYIYIYMVYHVYALFWFGYVRFYPRLPQCQRINPGEYGLINHTNPIKAVMLQKQKQNKDVCIQYKLYCSRVVFLSVYLGYVRPSPETNTNMSFWQYRDSPYEDKTVSWPFYLYHENPCLEGPSSHWDRAFWPIRCIWRL